ncbi:MAG: ribosome silencing factor [Leptolyngbyaceae cyanobacterium]
MSDLHPAVTPFQTTHQSSSVPAAADEATLAFATALAQAADDRKGSDIRILHVTDVSYITDYFVIVTGFSSAQVRAIARSISDVAAVAFERHPIRTEGQGEISWILQDYGEVIVHVFMPEARDYYGLEAFWGHAEDVPFTPSA